MTRLPHQLKLRKIDVVLYFHVIYASPRARHPSYPGLFIAPSGFNTMNKTNINDLHLEILQILPTSPDAYSRVDIQSSR
jgi:hypothetical protein